MTGANEPETRSETWQDRVASAVVRHGGKSLIAVILLSIVAGFFAARVQFDTSIEVWFLEDDPALLTYRAFLDRFHADEIVVVAVFADDVFDPDALAAIARLTEAARDAPHARRVDSLTTVGLLERRGQALEVVPLFPTIPTSRAEAEAKRRAAMASPLVVDQVVARDGRAAAIIVQLAQVQNELDKKIELAAALRDAAAAEEARVAGISVVVSGGSVLDEAMFDASQRDFLVLGPAAVLLVITIAFLVFGRPSAAIVPLVVVGLTALWTFGVMGAFGYRINLITTAIIPVIVAIGVADSIHLLADYYQEAAGATVAGGGARGAVTRAIAHLIEPCLFTSATTAVGFASLRVSSLAPIREFGLLASVAVVFAFIVSFGLIPGVLGRLRPPDLAFAHRQRFGVLSKVLVRLGRPGAAFRRTVLIGSIALVVASLLALRGIEVGSNPVSYFLPTNPARRDLERVEAALGGTVTIEVVCTSEDGQLLRHDNLERLDELQDWLESLPAVTHGLSFVDLLREANRVLHGGGAEHYVLPSAQTIAALPYLVRAPDGGEREDLQMLLTEDLQTARMIGLVRMSEARELANKAREVEAKLARDFPAGGGLRVEATGIVKLMGDMERYLVESQIKSLLVAFAVISGMMFLLLRSVRLGIFSMIPNLVPIIAGLAFMVLAGFALDPGTVMIGSIALGLVVDDTVHFLTRLGHQIRGGAPMEEAIPAAMRQTGRAIIVTSLALAASFSVMTLGSFGPSIAFGIVTTVVVILAAVADLVMLPAALLTIRPRVGGR